MGEARFSSRLNDGRAHVAGLLLVFAALGLVYAFSTPAFEAPDEASHFLYIHNLIETGELPLLEDRDTVFASQSVQRHHPPLYYLLGAALVGGFDRADVDDLLRPNPFASIGTVSPVNQNAFLHPLQPVASGALGAVLALRLFGIALGAGTVWLVYRAGRALGGRAAGLASAWLVACLPGFIFVSASVNNDTLVIFLSSAGVALLAEAWAECQFSRAKGVLLGLILGGIALTKINGLAFYGVVGIWALLAAWTQRIGWRRLVRPLLAAALIALLLASWWYLRNLLLYGDPLAMAATLRIWGRGAEGPVWGEAVGVWDSLWMVLGQFNVRGPDWFYRLYAPALAILGLTVTLWAAYRRRIDRGLVLFLAVTALASVAALVAATSRVNVSQGRILYPALAAFAPLWMVGLRRRFRWQVTAALLIPLMAFAVAAPLLYLGPAYAPAQAVDRVPPAALPVDASAGGLRIEALDIPRSPVRSGDVLPLTLYLSGANAQNPFLTLRAVHPVTQQVLGSVNVYPGMLPTDTTGDAGLLEIPLRLPITASVEQPVQLDLLFGWEAPLEGGGSQRLPLMIGGAAVDTLRLAGPVLLPESAAVAPAQHPLEATFGDAIRLEGYSLEAAPGELAVTLNFRPLMPMAQDYTLTVGLMSAGGEIIAQADGPVAGYPTSAWLPNVPLAETRRLALPGAVPDGAALFVGWYTLEDGARLPVDAVQARDNLLFLALE